MNKLKHRIYFQILLIYFLLVFGAFVFSKFNQHSTVEITSKTSRQILSLSNCTKRSVEEFPEDFMTRQERLHGGVIIHILLSLYLFMTLAIVCDDYLVSSLERICEVLNLSHDVAGATFLAMGGSAPELCTAVISIFITKTDVGVSTIVGSAVFNVLCVSAVCGIFAGKIVYLTWWPVFRDCISYCITIMVLICVLNDGIVYWYEGLIMVITYAMYAVLLFNSESVRLVVLKVLPISMKNNKAEYTPLLPQSDGLNVEVESCDNENIAETWDIASNHSQSQKDKDISHIEEETGSVFEIPNSFFKRLYWVTVLPVTVLCYLTIPDCRKPGLYRKLFVLTFIMSLIWISICTYLLVWMICITGDTLGIPDTVMGLTLLAAGASIPDAIAAYLVAKTGFGDMAICTSIGSNTLDILLGLGLPWLIKTGMINPGSGIQISSSGLMYTSMILLFSVVILVISIMINKWRLNRCLGVVFFVFYIIATCFSCLYELDIFGKFSLKPCPRTRF